MTQGLHIDASEFQRAFKEYLKVTSKTLPEAINQKAYSINIAAASLTPKVKAPDLEAHLRAFSDSKSGRPGPRAALIINAKRGKGQGLYGDAMKEELEKFIRKRRGHVAFLASGWLPAIAIMAAAIGKAVGKSAARRLEKATNIGGGIAAKIGFKPTAEFWNEAGAVTSHNIEGAASMAGEGLQAALTQEASRIDDHIAKKLQSDSDKFAGRLLR